MTYEDLISLGCTENDDSCKSAPSWVYSVNSWTASAESDSSIWFVDSSANLTTYIFDIPSLGLRPVITIKKSEL